MQRELYEARILDHARQPRNKRPLGDATHTKEASNPSCGDSLTMFLKVGSARTVHRTEPAVLDCSFTGEGCAISQAAASLLTEHVHGMPLQEATTLREEDVYTLLGVEVSIARRKCALLAWRALREALASAGKPTRTHEEYSR